MTQPAGVWRRVRSVLHGATPWVLATLALVLAAAAGWIRYRFGAITFDQLVTNLPVWDGANVGDDLALVNALLVCVDLPILVVLCAAWLVRRGSRGNRSSRGRLRLLLPALGVVVALGTLVTATGLPDYAAALLADRTIAGYYVPPEIVRTPSAPRNLITIYLESAEETFSDEAVFGQDLLAGLGPGTSGWATYHGLRQYPGGGWTMAGLVGTQCGIPLKAQLAIGRNANEMGEQEEHYLPGATCLGDLLALHGYTNAFLGGSAGAFAGKSTFLKDHGYTLVRGLEDWRAAGDGAEVITGWGLSDARLLEHARETIEELRGAGDPYNLTMLTLDSHDPPAVFPGCATEDTIALATALKCSTRAVSAFLVDLKERGYLDDTVVVLMADHLRILGESDAYRAELAGAPDRRLTLRVWSPDGVAYGRADADQLSMLATTLELLGFGTRDGRAGIGVSFAGQHDVSGTALALSPGDYADLVAAPSVRLYDAFWRPR